MRYRDYVMVSRRTRSMRGFGASSPIVEDEPGAATQKRGEMILTSLLGTGLTFFENLLSGPKLEPALQTVRVDAQGFTSRAPMPAQNAWIVPAVIGGAALGIIGLGFYLSGKRR